jgi:signal transduction histidine kinase
MFSPTLRFRMILLFLVVVGVFLAGIYWIEYRTFSKEVLAALDDRLLDQATLLKAEISLDPAAKHFDGLAIADPFIERLGPDNRVLERTPNLNGIDLQLESLPDSDDPTVKTVNTPHGNLRVVVYRLVLDKKREWIVVADFLAYADLQKERFRYRALGLWTLSLLLTTLIGAWYVGRSLAPIVSLREHAARLTKSISHGSNLEVRTRLPIGNPRDEVGLLAATFNELFMRLETVNCQLRKFVSDAAHELRTPLAILRGETQLLLSQPRPFEECQYALRTIDSELTVLVQIIEGLFTLSMADSGKLLLAREQVFLNEVMEEACGILASFARQSVITLDTTDCEPTEFSGDSTLLRQLFLILLENAIKYSPPNTTARVGTRTHKGRPEAYVKDEGIGISEEDLPHIFERFYRAAPQKSEGKRSGGLGLAIADAIARMHGGGISCLSTPGQGSRFTVIFEQEKIASVKGSVEASSELEEPAPLL